jgi:carbonic anhydrase
MHKNVLDLFKGHEAFLQGKPKNLAVGQNPSLMVISCSDSRTSLDKVIDAAPGTLFTHRNIGGFVAPSTVDDTSLQAFLNYPLTNMDSVKAITICGHTRCGGVKGLVNAVLSNARSETNDINRWVLSNVDQKLEHAIRDAHAKGVTEDQIIKVMEYLMPVVSAMHLMERNLIVDGKPKPVAEILKEKNISLVPAVFDLDTNTLQLFDPNQLQYRSISEIQLGQVASQPSEWVNRVLPQNGAIRLPGRESTDTSQGKSEGKTDPAPMAFAPGSRVAMGSVITPQQLYYGFQVGLNEMSRLGHQTAGRA